MNKKFTNFFSNYGMTINGNTAYGTVNGYETNAMVVMLDNYTPLRIHISFYATSLQKQDIELAVKKSAIKSLKIQLTPYGLSIGLNDITVNRLIKRLPEIFNVIYGIISDNGALKSDFCPVCGKPIDQSNSKKCNIDGFSINIDNDCVNTINSIITAENQDFKDAPNNYFKGFLGALIGGLVGAVVSVILYFLGFVSALSAVIAVVLGSYLYQKFHGKPNKVMIIIVTLTTFVLLEATIPMIYIFAAGAIAYEQGANISAIDAFRICMEEPEFARLFYVDLAMVLLFSAIGAGFEIFSLSKKIKRQTNI